MELLVPILSAVIALGSLVVAILTLLRNGKKDNETAGESRGVMASDIGYIKAGVDDLKKENRDNRESLELLRVKVAEVDSSTKQAHKRIDELSEYHKPHH